MTERPVDLAAVFPARISALSDVAAFTSRVCEAVPLDEDVCLKLILLVEELFTNTVAHGYGRDTEEPVRLAFAVEPGRVVMTYEDAGPPHDPFAGMIRPGDDAAVEDWPVGGLGVVLVAAIASDVEYRRADGRNRIRLAVAAPG